MTSLLVRLALLLTALYGVNASKYTNYNNNYDNNYNYNGKH